MRRRVPRLLTSSALTAVAGVLATTLSACAPTMASDPATWSNHDLAAQQVLAGVDMSRLPAATAWARAGIGGVIMFGTPPLDLGQQLAAVRAAGSVPPLIASDEEGGLVQRLTRVIYPLPSAATMGQYDSPAQIQSIAAAYGRRMKALHVDVDLAPVADLAIPGYYMASLGRALSATPSVVSADVIAWDAGMRSAGVLPVIKHWPGHGQASNTHVGAATTPPLSTLQVRDMIPFANALAAGAPAVMVGHLDVPGLTGGLPATLSPAAYSYLRRVAGPNKLIMTDSVTMGAVTTALGESSPAAAVRALQAGADVIVTDDADPMLEVAAITHALDTGACSRTASIAAVRRMLAAKRLVGD